MQKLTSRSNKGSASVPIRVRVSRADLEDLRRFAKEGHVATASVVAAIIKKAIAWKEWVELALATFPPRQHKRYPQKRLRTPQFRGRLLGLTLGGCGESFEETPKKHARRVAKKVDKRVRQSPMRRRKRGV
jgi:hypothetical protein